MKANLYKILQVAIFIISSVVTVFANGTGHMHSREKYKHEWATPNEEANRINPIQRTRDSIDRGAALFKTYCTGCHGSGGKGDGSAAKGMQPNPPDLTVMAGHHSDGDLAWKIATGKGPMPGWENTLNEMQIWDMVNFIKSLGGDAKTKHKHNSH